MGFIKICKYKKLKYLTSYRLPMRSPNMFPLWGRYQWIHVHVNSLSQGCQTYLGSLDQMNSMGQVHDLHEFCEAGTMGQTGPMESPKHTALAMASPCSICSEIHAARGSGVHRVGSVRVPCEAQVLEWMACVACILVSV